MHRLLLLAMTATVLGACSDHEILAVGDDPAPDDDAPAPGDDDDEPGDDDDALPDDDDDRVPLLAVHPASFAFAERPVGCTSELPITLSNAGDGLLTVSELHYASDGDDLHLLDAPSLPLQIDPGGSAEVIVGFTPSDDLDDEGVLTVVSDGGDGTSTHTGSAAPPVAAADEYLQAGNRSVDVLWMVDSSCSMAFEQEALGQNFGAFLDVVDSLELDYRIGVVTADLDDDGELQGDVPWVTPSTSDAEDVFADNVLVGQLGSGSEQGFDSVRRALIDGHAGGFLRDEAQLRVISVSDEDDQSVALADVAAYVAELQALKVSPAHVVHSDISGQLAGCVSSTANADAAPRYVEATEETRGLSTSICAAGWVQTLTDLAWLADSYADTFELSQPAHAASVEAFVDGVPVSGFGFDEALDAVVFDPAAVPPDGSLVRFEYAVVQPCAD